MFDRAWILDILSRLSLCYWPVFFWDVLWFQRYYRAYRAANPVGMLGVGVTQQGRILITMQAAGDRPDEPQWTALASRAPWDKLAPGAGPPETGPEFVRGIGAISAILAPAALRLEPG